MDDLLANMQTVIQEALDGVVSARSSPSKRSQALDELEQVLAKTLVRNKGSGYMETFQFLQDTFECNIPSRLIDWTSTASLRLDHLLSRGMSDSEKGTEAAILSGQLVQALSLIQGVALVHHRSKVLLGGEHAQEVLVDLLWASRHSGYPDSDNATSSTPSTPTASSSKPKAPVTLSSAVLDTLLCILVDSSPALRTFEKVGGVKTVVNLVKRPKALRDAKMKCLEFLYFYLLDESSPDSLSSSTSGAPASSTSSLSASPTIESRTRRAGRDASWGSNDSHSSNSSQSSSFSLSSSTSATSISSADRSPRTPPRSPNAPAGAATPRRPFAKPRALLLLQKDVDYTPLSPKKVHGSRAVSSRYGTPLKAPSLGVGIPSTPTTPTQSSSRRPSEDTSAAAEACNPDGTRSTEQKKEYLGTMLGNVDALVAGVRSAAVAFGPA